MYSDELKAIKKASLFRERVIYDENLLDLASNDYLGFSEDKELFQRACSRVLKHRYHAPKASQLINGYHQIHKEFEEYLCRRNGFESGIVVGSGFLANLSLLEALPRGGDLLVLDEKYHASGILASKLPKARVEFFSHNDADLLEMILKKSSYKRAIVAVEGVYSMDGDLLNEKIFDVADKFNALLIVDEAHSGGVLGENFLGIYEHYNIKIKQNHIKMGTLGKAYGSYGAYILADKEIVEFLQNRAKAIIYATAPSVFDTALAYEGFLKLEDKVEEFRKKRDRVLQIANRVFNKSFESTILTIDIGDNKKVLQIKEKLLDEGILVGAIRTPTVKSAILRVILRLDEEAILQKALLKIKEVVDGH
jgi:8-amino-7-oxononanoate synthase